MQGVLIVAQNGVISKSCFDITANQGLCGIGARLAHHISVLLLKLSIICHMAAFGLSDAPSHISTHTYLHLLTWALIATLITDNHALLRIFTCT